MWQDKTFEKYSAELSAFVYLEGQQRLNAKKSLNKINDCWIPILQTLVL